MRIAVVVCLSLCALGSAVHVVASGPDLITSSVGVWFPDETGVKKLGTIDGVTAYSMAVFSCNIGDADLPWHGFTADHPTLAQNLYRLHDGRLEQIGAGPAKHVVATVPQDLFCGTCDWPGSFILGVGCSDPYDADRNAEQDRLGPRRDINPVTGVTPYPFTSIGDTGDALMKRMRVKNSDLDPANYPGARFFVEAQYMSEADTVAGNQYNNSGYREVVLGAFADGGWELVPVGDVVAESTVLGAWTEDDPAVSVEKVDIPGDGRVYLASRATENPSGVWNYEYALLNYNSRQAVRGFSVPVANACALSQIGFHSAATDPVEMTNNDPWSIVDASGVLLWFTASRLSDPNANALRWSMTDNFRFTTACPPAETNGAIKLDLFLEGEVDSVTIPGVVPMTPPRACNADLTGATGDKPDGVVDTFDLLFLLKQWGPCFPPGNCASDIAGPSSNDADAAVDTFDLLLLLGAWGTSGDC